jgi:hypothetical protein
VVVLRDGEKREIISDEERHSLYISTDQDIGFKKMILTRPEGEGCIVIRRRPITQSKAFILKPIA